MATGKQRVRIKVKKKRKSGGSNLKRKIVLAFLFLVGLVSVVSFVAYQAVYASNFDLGEKEYDYFYVRSTDSYSDVVTRMQSTGYVENEISFEWVLDRKNYVNNVIPGKYKIENGMSNNEVVNMLRSGRQEIVKVTLNMENTLAEVAGKLAQLIEVDSARIMEIALSPEFQLEHNLTPPTTLCIFVPNTYDFYWATSEEATLKRFWQEYQVFWTKERIAKAEQWGLSPHEITTLASIVFKETTKMKDAPTIAGVYLNRIRLGMPLQADPTLIFALNDKSIRRVLNVHKQVDSPYNTYKYRGLPPGPIANPSTKYIDAVLNAPRHNYLYFCAKEDFSGYSNFSETYSGHIANAKKYQTALNKRKIYS